MSEVIRIRSETGLWGSASKTPHGLLTAAHNLAPNMSGGYQLIKQHPRLDLALLTGSDRGYEIAPGEPGPALAIGWPLGRKVIAPVQVTEQSPEIWLVDSPCGAIAPGMSGGPLIQNGCLIGVVYCRVSEAYTSGYAVRGGVILDWLGRDEPGEGGSSTDYAE